MEILNKICFDNKRAFALQTIFVILTMFIILLPLSLVSHSLFLGALGGTSLGSSCFTVFISPKSSMVKPRRLIGGYTIACLCGIFTYFLFELTKSAIPNLVLLIEPIAIFSALSIGFTTILMILFDMEHPPAAGLSIGLIFESWDIWTVIVVIAASVMLAIIWKSFHKYFIPLHQS